jgi:hypothetical protein
MNLSTCVYLEMWQVTVPIRFVAKICNTNLDAFRNNIGKEVFIIKGNKKGY